jgi:hypothetical protein
VATAFDQRLKVRHLQGVVFGQQDPQGARRVGIVAVRASGHHFFYRVAVNAPVTTRGHPGIKLTIGDHFLHRGGGQAQHAGRLLGRENIGGFGHGHRLLQFLR